MWNFSDYWMYCTVTRLGDLLTSPPISRNYASEIDILKTCTYSCNISSCLMISFMTHYLQK